MKKLISNFDFLNKKQIILIHTKSDTIKLRRIKYSAKTNQIIKISVKNNLGLDNVLTCLSLLAELEIELPSATDVVLCTARQNALLNRANKVVLLGIKDLDAEIDMDIIASTCRVFVNIMEELLGTVSSNDVLNNIFKGFCVGK